MSDPMGCRTDRPGSQAPARRTIQPFLIFTAGCNASVVLSQALAMHPDMTCAGEPFAGCRQSNSLCASNEQELRSHLDMLYATYTGIHHVWGTAGFPFSDESMNDIVLTHRHPQVIFLNCRNVLRQAVEEYLSTHPSTKRRGQASTRLTSVDPTWIEAYLRNHHASVQRYRDLLDNSGIAWMEIMYEDLFRPMPDPEMRATMLDEVVQFLGARRMGEERNAALWLLESRSSFSSVPAARRVANAAALDNAFGSHENGYLRSDHSRSALTRIAVHRGLAYSGGIGAAENSPGADALLALEAQNAYLQHVVQTQYDTMRHMERKLVSTPIRFARAVERVMTKISSAPKPHWVDFLFSPIHIGRPVEVSYMVVQDGRSAR